MRKLLSIDGSTTVCGYTIWNIETKEWFKMSYYSFNKENSLIQKAEEFEVLLNQILIEHPEIDEMVIEESFTKFSTSDDEVIAKLNQINILYRYICHKKGLKTNTINVKDARRSTFSKQKFLAKKHAGGMDQKEQAFCFLLAEIGETHFPTKILKSGPRKGQTVFIDEAKDMSDSWITGKGFLNINYKK